jgi:glycosyltransferase involved in cell wall biosynthesis
METILTVADLQPESGGPSRTVPALATALANLGVSTHLVSLRQDGAFGRPVTAEQDKFQAVPVRCRSHFAKITGSGMFQNAVLGVCRGTKNIVLHDNGLWLGTNHGTVRAARIAGLPLMISPRGMLSGWSLRHKGWKKAIAWRLYQQADLRRAEVLHATSVAEAENFREIGLTQPVAVIPNGVFVPPARVENGPKRKDERILLFLSRIHQKKGLLTLVQAWAAAQPEGWRGIIAGTDEGGHLDEVKAEAKRRQVERDFSFPGPVDGAAKWDLYRSADLFVLPSHSENFGLVVAEALGCGVPVITTRGTPWEELETHRCGWWIQNTPEALADALREATSRTDNERREMGARGRKLVEENYTWPGVAKRMKAVYEWMLRTGPKPECVLA